MACACFAGYIRLKSESSLEKAYYATVRGRGWAHVSPKGFKRASDAEEYANRLKARLERSDECL